ncbi:unnamed protein product [Protopolystoma xenopodis]|uniref:Uncharacterized protein n=1 Tax=Protopolystoma xenopodis TaxID=117903 RepID=A0A448XJ08_9PLAT|nr:unnamed protein product [Protopolystoma xenopodis]
MYVTSFNGPNSESLFSKGLREDPCSESRLRGKVDRNGLLKRLDYADLKTHLQAYKLVSLSVLSLVIPLALHDFHNSEADNKLDVALFSK